MNAIDRPLSRVLHDVASLINSSVDLDTTMQHLVDAACHHTIWSMAGVMSIDEASGDALVVTRHDPNLLSGTYRDRWTLATSPSLTALTRGEPIVIRDAQAVTEYPGYQEEAVQRGYRTVVVLPLGCRDMEGRAMVLSVQSRSIVELGEADLSFLETIGHLGAIAVDKAHRLRAERVATERLQTVLSAQSALMHKVLSDGSVGSAATMAEAFLANPMVVVDLTANLVVAGRSPRKDVVDDAAWREEVDKKLNRQLLKVARQAADGKRLGASRLYLNCGGQHLDITASIEPLTVDDETVGALIVFPPPEDPDRLDNLLLESAKFALSVQMMRSHVRFQSDSQTSSELFAEIVSGNWRNIEDVTARARRLGIEVNAPARLIAISLPHDTSGVTWPLSELHRSIVRLGEQQNPSPVTAVLDDIILCRVPGFPKENEATIRTLVRKIIEEAKWSLDIKPIVVISKTCSNIQDHATVWRECERMVRLAVRFNRTGQLTTQDFGPFPLLLSAADTNEVRSFIEMTIGQVVRHDEDSDTDYIKTLTSFLEHGCRSQACADALGLHVTTLRYRLNRIQELFGIEIDTPERRFALELAIRLNETLSQDAQI